ncbi:MAG TPA: LacI family DNA-binding transcriptional regulator [Geminicoccaceae bacterium]|nr:LacI family DNA-binding transcriptional regulator [Geminicoccaceae bacterium]
MSNPAREGGSDSGRRPTIKDVAREAGVSFKTVSRVMNRDGSVNAAMREAVEAAMAKLGYRPHRAARALRSSRTYAIALLAGSHDEPAFHARAPFPEYLGEVIAGCVRACRPAGFHLVLELLAYGDRRKAASVAGALLDDLAPDGVVLTPPLCDLAWLLYLLEQRAMAYVRLMPGALPGRGACLSVDDFAAAKDLTERLLAAGHRHLAFISGPPDHLAAQARREGFEAAVAACPGARSRIGEGDFFLASGEREGRRLLSGADRPTALFAANDAMAAGALRAAAALGLAVPHDVAVAGFDDSSIAGLTTPALTSVRQPTAELAHRAATVLIDASGKGTSAMTEQLRLACTIVERASTGPIHTEFEGERLP